MKRVVKVFIATLIIVLVAWRAMWLRAGLVDNTSLADEARQNVLPSLAPVGTEVDDYEWLVVFGETPTSPESLAGTDPNWRITQTQIWDPTAEVWIVPGKDGQPGWAKWDDNGDGKVDELSELGAAWSDDHCVTPLNAKFQHVDREHSRLIQQGTFREARPDEANAPTNGTRVRFVVARTAARVREAQ